MKNLLYLSGVFALICVGLLALQTTRVLTAVANQSIATLQSVQNDARESRQMLNATLYQIADVSHEAANVIRDERSYVEAENRALLRTTENANQTIDEVRAAVNSTAGLTQQALLQIPPVLEQTEKTLRSAQDAEDQLTKTVAALDPAITQLSVTLTHVAAMSTQADYAVTAALKPKPLYKRILNDLWVPAKLIAIFY